MLFDLTHSLFMVFSLIIVVSLLIIFSKFIKNEKGKEIVLKFFAVLTVILHFSSLWVEYFKNGSATVTSEYLLPVYPCHIAMWLLFICAFYKNKDSKFFKGLATFTFYLGFIGGIFGVLLNEAYAGTPDLTNWRVLKGLISHITMLIGCIYLVVGKFTQIRVSNLISVTIGLVCLIIDGGIMIGLHKLAGIDAPNAMYLLEKPFPNLPWLNTWSIGFMAIFLLFIFTAIFEFFTLKKEERWYSLMKLKINEKKSKKGGDEE